MEENCRKTFARKRFSSVLRGEMRTYDRCLRCVNIVESYIQEKKLFRNKDNITGIYEELYFCTDKKIKK